MPPRLTILALNRECSTCPVFTVCGWQAAFSDDVEYALMSSDPENCMKQLDELLSLPHQIWLLGAGISKNAGIPLMNPLTQRVQDILADKDQVDFKAIRDELPHDAHVEHVLSHLGDMMAIAARSRHGAVTLGKVKRTLAELRDLHARVQQAIRDTIRWGYFPEEGTTAERIGTAANPIVSVDHHVTFIRALFGKRRAGLERRPPIAFYTTNYDTLLEDAIALCRIPSADGFTGGATAFWDPSRFVYSARPELPETACQAMIYKLHGSIDWFISAEDIVVAHARAPDTHLTSPAPSHLPTGHEVPAHPGRPLWRAFCQL